MPFSVGNLVYVVHEECYYARHLKLPAKVIGAEIRKAVVCDVAIKASSNTDIWYLYTVQLRGEINKRNFCERNVFGTKDEAIEYIKSIRFLMQDEIDAAIDRYNDECERKRIFKRRNFLKKFRLWW